MSLYATRTFLHMYRIICYLRLFDAGPTYTANIEQFIKLAHCFFACLETMLAPFYQMNAGIFNTNFDSFTSMPFSWLKQLQIAYSTLRIFAWNINKFFHILSLVIVAIQQSSKNKCKVYGNSQPIRVTLKHSWKFNLKQNTNLRERAFQLNNILFLEHEFVIQPRWKRSQRFKFGIFFLKKKINDITWLIHLLTVWTIPYLQHLYFNNWDYYLNKSLKIIWLVPLTVNNWSTLILPLYLSFSF